MAKVTSACLYSGHVVKVDHIGLAGGPDTGYERKKGFKKDSRALAWEPEQ